MTNPIAEPKTSQNEVNGEQVTAWIIFIILLLLATGTAYLLLSYHKVDFDNDGFWWNPRDGSTLMPKPTDTDPSRTPSFTPTSKSNSTEATPAGTFSTPGPTLASLSGGSDSALEFVSIRPVVTVNATSHVPLKSPAPQTANVAQELEPTEQQNIKSAPAQTEQQNIEPDPAQYVSWFLAATLGTTLFLMKEVVYWYPKLDRKRSGRRTISFYSYLPWYIGNFLQGPVIVLVIMWLLTNINISLGTTSNDDNTFGVGIRFGNLPAIVLLAIAFMLGYYSRTARAQLDMIMKRILPAAWAESHKAEAQLFIEGKAQITPGQEESYTLSIDSVATWKVPFAQHIESLYIWADDQAKPQSPTDLANLPNFSIVGKYLYIKTGHLVSGQPGMVHIQAVAGDQTANFDVEIVSTTS